MEIYFDNLHYRVTVELEDVEGAETLFHRMDADMDGGWRMGSRYVARPSAVERVQIVAHRMMIALEQGNEATARAMAAYILSRMPGVAALHIDSEGEMSNTRIEMDRGYDG